VGGAPGNRCFYPEVGPTKGYAFCWPLMRGVRAACGCANAREMLHHCVFSAASGANHSMERKPLRGCASLAPLVGQNDDQQTPLAVTILSLF